MLDCNGNRIPSKGFYAVTMFFKASLENVLDICGDQSEEEIIFTDHVEYYLDGVRISREVYEIGILNLPKN